MKKLITAAALAAFALPALGDEAEPAEAQPESERLADFELLSIGAVKEEQPVDARLQELEIVVSTAEKEQPASHEVDDKTAALLAEIAKEEE